MSDGELDELTTFAGELGVHTGYWDVHGNRHDADIDQLRSAITLVLGQRHGEVDDVHVAMDGWRQRTRQRSCEPVVVRWGSEPVRLRLRLPRAVRQVELTWNDEQGQQVIAPAPVTLATAAVRSSSKGGFDEWHLELGDAEIAALGPGRYHLEIHHGSEVARTVVLSAPERVLGLDEQARLWGVFAPIYSLWSSTRRSATLGHLGRLAEWIDGAGGKVVGTLPLLATFLDAPCAPSPYTPVSRRWWNESYLDLAARPEVRNCRGAMSLLDTTSPAPPTGHPSAAFDAVAQAAATRAVIGALVEADMATGSRLRDAVEQFAAAQPDVRHYARFRAEVERTRCSWHEWPDRASTSIDIARDDPGYLAHLYGQWAMTRQLGALDETLSERDQLLYLDLPVGVSGDGYDTFAEPHLFAWGAAAGAPPDEFFTSGQNWGFPPLSPWASREDGHAHLARSLAAHMAVCGLLRLDHVMALHRLFWVPDGEPAHRGVYVSYPADELFAVLAIESHRNRCAVVGEDLGTVSEEVRDRMHRHGLTGMYVAQFSQGSAPGAPLDPPGAQVVASVNTHDTPTFAGWCAGDDISRRMDMGLLDEEQTAGERSQRRIQVSNLASALGVEPSLADAAAAGDEPAVKRLLAALLARLGHSDAPVVFTSLDDLLGTVEPQNVPGTPVQRPNWVLRYDRPLDELQADPQLAAVLADLQGARLGSWSRAVAAQQQQ